MTGQRRALRVVGFDQVKQLTEEVQATMYIAYRIDATVLTDAGQRPWPLAAAEEFQHGRSRMEVIPAILARLSESRQCDALLSHIFARPIGITDLARLIAFQEQELARALIRVDFRG